MKTSGTREVEVAQQPGLQYLSLRHLPLLLLCMKNRVQSKFQFSHSSSPVSLGHFFSLHISIPLGVAYSIY